MKTTIEIPDALMEQARRLAAREHTTLRALVEQGLREVIADKKRAAGFRLRRATFKGSGLQPPLRDAGWERIRDMSYEGRGG
ncbi:MAG: type II toxin-antitoxin system VapB family antitoxin [Rhodocyclaceae bacterium]|nr:type II toxin-antitoxin system VapB family antitoxin [Rhodocyclaceae bacterium]